MWNEFAKAIFDRYIPFGIYEIRNESVDLLKMYNINLMDLECKHIKDVNQTTIVFKDLADKVNYEWVVLGSHRNSTISEEINIISEMSKSVIERPIRIVITKDRKVWSDNTHWTIAYILKYGIDVKLKDVPFYIVDLEIEIIRSYRNSVNGNKDDIDNIINNSKDIQKRLDVGWRNGDLSYKIRDLYSCLFL